MKFWSMDIPGRHPVVLLWAWWVSLALSRSLNFASFPVQIPVQSSVLIRQRHHSVFFLWCLLIVVTRYPQSPNRNQQASRHAQIRESSRFSLNRTLSSIFSTKQFIFRLVFRELRECSQDSSSAFIFLQFLPVSVPELLVQFLTKPWRSIHFPRISKRFSTFAYVTLRLLMFRLATTCLHQTWRSLWQFLFLFKQ